MFKMIKQLFALLSPEQVKDFYILQVLVVIMAFFELVGIASIAPFMALVGDISLLQGNGIFAKAYALSGITQPNDFLFYVGIIVLLSLTISALISMFTIWRLSSYGARVGMEIANRLYEYYMKESWQFHSINSSAQLTKQISTESMRITNGIVQPLMQMNAKIVLAVFITGAIIIYNPIIAFIGLSIFVSAYFILYKTVRKKLINNGRMLSELSTERFRLMNEGFGGIKDILLLNRGSYFINKFKISGSAFAKAQGTNIAISQVPRYFMELIAFGTMIGLVLLLLKLYDGNLGKVLPVLAVYALAAFKLLPALQQIYSSITQIKGDIAAFDAIKLDLEKSKYTKIGIKSASKSLINFEKSIQLNDIKFNYPEKSTFAVENININIPVNSLIGFVGASGSGKSTLIDIISGLLIPKYGNICIDGQKITEDNIESWQNKIGFVPQSIFLSEGTIAENIAFGIASNKIDLNQINRVIDMANLTELVKDLPLGVNTKVGERGVQLSGGQRQRIGIARALYHEAEILIFDEATSALDGITEKIIMDAIHNFSGKKTIIMIAHRLKTVGRCDQIYLMEKGKVIDYGTYDYLVKNNEKFKKMALYS